MALLGDTVMAARAGEISGRQIVREGSVALPIAEVWRLWTTSDGIAEWLVESSEVELEIGGAYELYFLPDEMEGSRGGEGCRILSFLPERMLSFTWNAPPSFPDERAKRTWVVVELSEMAASETLVVLTHLGWPESCWHDGSKWPEVYAYFESAWTNVLEALVSHGSRGS